MIQRKSSLFLALTILFTFAFLMATGCKKDDKTVNDEVIIETEATQDAAEAVASSISINNGGAMDIVEDMLDASTTGGIITTPSTANDGSTQVAGAQKEYDSTTGWWTVTILRQRGNDAGQYYANYQRVTKHQFLNKNGEFQKNYITVKNGANDTAYTINHEIVSGIGVAHTPKVSHRLINLTGKWVAIKTNTSIVTINSLSGFPFTRSAADTITRNGALRTLSSTLTLNFSNVTGPRVSRVNWHQATQGTITGHYHADVTFTRGGVYREKTIDRDITITLGGNPIKIKVGDTSFDMNAETGDVY